MSALGHKQTYAAQNAMSALPPIVTAKTDCKMSCPLYPQNRRCLFSLEYLAANSGHSGLLPEIRRRTQSSVQNKKSFIVMKYPHFRLDHFSCEPDQQCH